MDDFDASSFICITDIDSTFAIANYSGITEFTLSIIDNSLSSRISVSPDTWMQMYTYSVKCHNLREASRWRL